MKPLLLGRDGNTDDSGGANARRCTGWGASRGEPALCLLIGSKGYCRMLDRRSRMRRELHVRFCEGGGVQFPSATRRTPLRTGLVRISAVDIVFRSTAI